MYKKHLNIGIDIRDLQTAKTGTRTYLEELCKALYKLSGENLTIHFLDTKLSAGPGESKLSKYSNHFFYQLWKQVILPLKAARKHCDFVLCTDNFVPLVRLGYQTVPVFHDAFFFENPEHYGKLWLKLYHLTALPAARKSAFVITPTAYAQKQLAHYTNIPQDHFKVVYEGPKTRIDHPSAAVLQQFNLLPQQYILHVGSPFKRKNIPALIRAFAALKTENPSSIKLVLAGPDHGLQDNTELLQIQHEIQTSGYAQEIIITGYLSEDELAGIYTYALFYVFPSLNEGFGIPVLEAFQYGIPVMVADNTCLPEVGGDAVLTFNPKDDGDITAKMHSLQENAQLRSRLIQAGKARLSYFSWDKAATELIQLFKEHQRP
ncbi:glycosyltransferase family 1 protein [Pedobacter antarcticus]|uniref:glycosyltransferase family 4 protein n=1 Tax=Pedobacter antarcticus TaxID=34086 RepID=UPI00292EC1E7|nr:glycosyltransferase family 1 protein [Pedobacter antarcticus]